MSMPGRHSQCGDAVGSSSDFSMSIVRSFLRHRIESNPLPHRGYSLCVALRATRAPRPCALLPGDLASAHGPRARARPTDAQPRAHAAPRPTARKRSASCRRLYRRSARTRASCHERAAKKYVKPRWGTVCSSRPKATRRAAACSAAMHARQFAPLKRVTLHPVRARRAEALPCRRA